MIPYWLLRLLPMWDHICPKCRREVRQKSHKCPYCGENYGVPLRVPPKVLKDKKALEAYVHERVFPKISQSHRDYLTQFFTVLFSDGFESGDFTAWTGTASGAGGTITTSEEQRHHGKWSAKASIDGLLPDEYGTLYKDFGSTYSTMFCRAYVRFTNVPAFDTNQLQIGPVISGLAFNDLVGVWLYNNAGTIQWGLFYATDAVPWNWIYSSGPPVPTEDMWYCLEVKFVGANGTGEARLWIDGSPVLSITGLTNDDRLAQEVYVDCYAPSSGYATDVYSDCVVVADARIGCEKIPIMNLRPRSGDIRRRLEFTHNLKRPPIRLLDFSA